MNQLKRINLRKQINQVKKRNLKRHQNRKRNLKRHQNRKRNLKRTQSWRNLKIPQSRKRILKITQSRKRNLKRIQSSKRREEKSLLAILKEEKIKSLMNPKYKFQNKISFEQQNLSKIMKPIKPGQIHSSLLKISKQIKLFSRNQMSNLKLIYYC